MRKGTATHQIYYEMALAYSGRYRGIQNDTAHGRLASFFAGDNNLIDAAYSGFHQLLSRQDLPSVDKIIELHFKEEPQSHYLCLPCLMAINELFESNSACLRQLDSSLLAKLLAYCFHESIGENPKWRDILIQENPKLVSEVLLAYGFASLRTGKELISEFSELTENAIYSKVAEIVIPKLLKHFHFDSSEFQASNLKRLLRGAIRHLNKNVLLDFLPQENELKKVDPTQQIYWLVYAAVIDPVYCSRLKEYLKEKEDHSETVAEFLREGNFITRILSEKTLSFFIEVLAPYCSPERMDSESFEVTPAMEAADTVRHCIEGLVNHSSKEATAELERLLKLEPLSDWHSNLNQALYFRRTVIRNARFLHPDVQKIEHALDNFTPANAADLAALTYEHLLVIATKIRDGNTNDFKQYWSYDTKYKKLRNPKSKPEDDCRDALLSDLQEKLANQEVDAQREGHYANDKRADIRVSFNGANKFNVPIEIKKNSHKDVWGAINSQLIQKYTRDPEADGYGIYLIFWFGEKEMQKPPNGETPSSASELKNQLEQTVNPENVHRIKICVIDCALPSDR